MLLVLDNLEQVTGLASFLSDLLRSCPHLRLLVTSRRPLHLQEEQKFPLGLRLREDVHHRDIQRAATKLLLHANRGMLGSCDGICSDTPAGVTKCCPGNFNPCNAASVPC